MTDSISRAGAIETVLKYFIPRSHTGERGEHEEDFVRMIFKAIPSADAVQGEWIYDHHNDEHTCSVCGRKALCDDYVGIDWQMEVLSDYCPSCGAKMCKGGDSE